MKRLKLTAFMGLLALCGTASAQDFYAGAGIGITQIEDEDQGISFKDSPFGWRLFAGVDLNENFAIEGGYINTGEAEDDIFGSSVEAELSALTISLLGLVPVNEQVTLFGKAGYYDGEQEASIDGFRLPDEDDSGVILGAGIRYALQDRLTLRGEFDWFDTDLDTLWSASVSLQYAFGN